MLAVKIGPLAQGVILMKHAQLRSMAHNIADSLASGLCLMVGYRDVDVFAEARRAPGRSLRIDFLNGTITGTKPTRALQIAVTAFKTALPDICTRHKVPLDQVCELSAEFSSPGLARLVTVTVTDSRGRRSSDDYAGVPLAKIRVLDTLGRVRRQKHRP